MQRGTSRTASGSQRGLRRVRAAGTTRPPGSADRGSPTVDPSVLVVDDDPVSARLMGSALELSGFSADWTADPLRALELMRDRRYALLVTDVHMPQMLGTTLAAEVRKIRPETKIMLVTAFAGPDVRARADAFGTIVLTKPVRIDALAAAARQLLEPRAARSAAS